MASLNTVQAGAVTLAATDTNVNVSISAVDTSKTFLVIQVDSISGANIADRSMGMATFSDNSTINFQRFGTGSIVTYFWQAAEFSSGVVVQHGTMEVLTTSSNMAVLPIEVNTSQSFVFLDVKAGRSSYDQTLHHRAFFYGTTSVQVLTGSTGLGANKNWVTYQAVDFTGASVQWGTNSFATTDSIQVVTLTPVDPSKTAVFYNQNNTDGSSWNISRISFNAYFQNGTTLILERPGGGSSAGLTWFVIEYSDGTSVQAGTSGQFSLASTSIGITQVNTAQSVAWLSGPFLRGGLTNAGATANPHSAWGYSTFEDESTIRLQRRAATSTANWAWYVTQFNSGTAGPVVAVNDFSFVMAGF